MFLFWARVFNLFFLKRWKPTSRVSRKPSKSEASRDLTSPLNSPELLKLKKDLW